MRNERIAIAQDVASHLADAERSNDLAIVATARLAAKMLEARLAMNAAAQVGQEAFEAVATTFSRQSASRRELIEAHRALDDARGLVGLREIALGGLGDKDTKVLSAGLRVVERDAA